MTHVQFGPRGQIGVHGVLGNLTLDQLNNIATHNPAAAAQLLDMFSRAGGPGLQQLLGGNMAPAGYVGSPMQMYPINQQLSGGGYAGYGGAQRQQIDLAPGSPNNWFARMADPNRRAAAQFESLLKSNPSARASFENAIGGRIVGFGQDDGRLTIERFAPGFAPIPGMAYNPMANTGVGILSGMEQSVLGQAGKLGLLSAGAGALVGGGMGLLTGNPFGGFMLGGLSGLASGLLSGSMGMGMGGMGMGGMGMGIPGMGMGIPGFGGGFGMGAGGFPGAGFPFGMVPPGAFGQISGLGNPVGAGGVGSWNPLAMPGRIQNTNPGWERAHQAQVASVLNDPSLTVEDKVTLMLMLIMKHQDREIENQANYINAIQQQQGNKNQMGGLLQMAGGVAGTVFGGPLGGMAGGMLGGMLGGQDGNNSPSIDVETMKLKRMIDKRSQMFDMLRQIIDKYNETAKGVIQSIGR